MNQQQGQSKFDAKLKGMSASFSTAQKQAKVSGGDAPFPEGIFVGKVTAKLRESNTSGNMMVSRMFVPVDGDMQGVACFDNLVIQQPNPASQLRAQKDMIRFLDLCGYSFDTGAPEKLPFVLAELTTEAPVVRFKVRHSTGGDGTRTFTNVDVLELVNAGDTGSGEGTAVASLKEFCDAQSIAYEKDDEVSLKTAITDHIVDNGKFPADNLTPEETVLLETSGLKKCIAVAQAQAPAASSRRSAPATTHKKPAPAKGKAKGKR